MEGGGGGGQLFSGTPEFKELLNKFHLYCISLSEMIEMSEKYIKAMSELASLKTVRQHLTRQDSAASTERYAVMEDNVPDELKCPVCFEIFEGDVLQCRNGHSVCFHCCETLRECPECRVEYGAARNGGGKIRNRTVEKLMHSLKIDCPYSPAGCRIKMTCKEMQEHAEECEFMNKPIRSPEYLETKRKIKKASGEVKRLEKKLGETNKQLMDCKADWILARDENVTTVQLTEAAEAFELEEKEHKVTAMYVELNQLLQLQL